LPVLVVENFEGVAVKDGDDRAGEVGNGSEKAEQEQERAMARKRLNKNRREQRARAYLPPRHTIGGQTKRCTFDEIEPSAEG
jgi:hypothetical protein